MNEYKIPTPEEFNAMTPAEKRVAIARDVLALREAKRLCIEQGFYFTGNEVSIGDPVCSMKDQTVCHVCALSAAILAACRLDPGFHSPIRENSESDNATGIRNALRGIFERKQIDLIEAAFEWDSNLKWYALDEEDLGLANRFGALNFDDDPSLLFRAIWQNVIDNGGEFKPDAVKG